MSRSYRKPFTSVTGIHSCHDDKTVAARGVRKRQNQWLRNLKDYDRALVPHRLECRFNNVYCWGRDGNKKLFPPYLLRDPYYSAFGYASWLKAHRK